MFAHFASASVFVIFFIYHFTPSLITGEEQQSPATYDQPFASILYTTTLNDKASLPCDITPSTLDDQAILILWYKDDQLTPIFTVDARRGYLDHPKIHSSQFLESRAHFNLNASPAHLHIEPIQTSDAGDYRCRVDFKRGRTVNTVIALTVIVPPQKPKIIDSVDNELKGIVGPYNEGDELALSCVTRGGKPRPSLSWWMDYAIIDNSYEFDDKELTSNQLTISPLSRHHLLSILTCQAVNNNVTLPSSTSITLDMNLKPTEVRITQLTPILISHVEALFECVTVGSRPMPILHWMFDGKRYDTRSQGEQQTSTTLTLTLERQHRGAILECVSQNLKIPNSAISDQIRLDVQYSPQLSLKLGSPTMSLDTIQEGIDIYFDCHIDANPRPTTPIVWIFNGNALHPQQGVIESNQSLVLQRVVRWQSGTYQCQSSNQHGTALSNPIVLTIRYAPVCAQSFKLVYGVSLHETVAIDCEVDANPAQVSFQWKFESYTNLATFSQINDSSSVLAYTPHVSQEFGTIECVAKNAIGIQRESCKYLIVPYSAPHFPFTCQVVNHTDTTLTIECYGIDASSQKIGNNTEKFANSRHNSRESVTNSNSNTNSNSYPYTRNSYFDPNLKPTSKPTETLIVYPITYYFLEIYGEHTTELLLNMSMRATETRLANPDSSFTFTAKHLPPDSSLVAKIFARNTKGASSAQLELKAHTLKSAERLVEYKNGATNSTSNAILKRLRGEHFIIALLIGAAIVVLIVIALGLIAVFRVRYSSSSIQLTPDGLDYDRELPPAETMLDSNGDEECRIDEKLLKCANSSMMMMAANESSLAAGAQGKNGDCCKNGKGPPDIIPVPYFVNCGDSGAHSYSRDYDDLKAKYRSVIPETLYPKSPRVVVYKEENIPESQLRPQDYQPNKLP